MSETITISATDDQQTITQCKAAKRYGVSERTLSRWERDGKIHGKRVRGLKLYRVSELDEVTGNEKN